MRKKEGFTLVELLVVIAIIALLLATLMPSLTKARQLAKGVVCKSNLKQWGLVWSLYTQGNNGYYIEGRQNGNKKTWMEVLKSFYQNSSLMICPSASVPRNPTGVSGGGFQGGTFIAWGVFPGGTTDDWNLKGACGSYGVNEFTSNPPQGTSPTFGMSLYWKKIQPIQASIIPVMGDSWFIGGWPQFDASSNAPPLPPEYDGHIDSTTAYQMGRFCLNRHNQNVYMLFMDSSVRKVGLKELWRLKWNPKFNTNARMPAWGALAPWMKNFKDY